MNMQVSMPSGQPVVFERDGSVFASSRDVAGYFEKDHRNVLRDIDRLVEQEPSLAQGGMLTFEQTPYVEPSNGQTYRSYVMTRDGFTLLAMGFTGAKALKWKLAYIKAFNAMEAEIKSAGIPKTMGEALQLAADQYKQIESMREDVQALDRISQADGSMCITDAAKALQMRPKDLFAWLSQNGWIYKRAGAGHYLGYHSKTNTGLLEHKTTTILRADGSEKVTEQVRVTAKGLTILAKQVPNVSGVLN